jgi:hypothetical protein
MQCDLYSSYQTSVHFFGVYYWPVHPLDEEVSSREDASTSWPSNFSLRGRGRTYITILELAEHAFLKR